MNSQQYKSDIWKMKIAIKISISNNQSPPMYLMIYRQHYLIFYYQQIYDHFNAFFPQPYTLNHLQLNFKNTILPYSIPFGVLVDLYQQEDNFTPLNIVLIYTPTPQFTDLEQEIKNQLKFNLKWASFGRYNHEGFGAPLKLLQQYTRVTEEEKVFKLIRSFEDMEYIQQYYQKIFEDANVVQIPVRIYFQKGGHLQTILEVKEPALTISQALKSVINGGDYIFSGLPLNLDIPAMYFYASLYSIDGFCYFVCK